MESLNNNDFAPNEGYKINDESINNYISRLKINERKNDNSNFLPIHKEEMTQQQENPLEPLVQNTITVHDLLGIYNRYAPNPLTEQQLQEMTNRNESLAKAHLINQILSHARDGTLFRSNTFGRTSERKGMVDLAKIVLDLQRDIKRFKHNKFCMMLIELFNELLFCHNLLFCHIKHFTHLIQFIIFTVAVIK